MCRHTVYSYTNCKHVDKWEIDVCFEPEALGESGTSLAQRDSKTLRQALKCKDNKIYSSLVVSNNMLIANCPKCVINGCPQTTISVSTGVQPRVKRVMKKDTGTDQTDNFMTSMFSKEGAASTEPKEDWESIFYTDAELDVGEDDEDDGSEEDDASKDLSAHDAGSPVKK
ncbi:hypothetical protein DTO212C5_6618 [Paecilomyces variotii]|nr:hypothetical protein DTO212C5_6618 [Paecilomyces variotii]